MVFGAIASAALFVACGTEDEEPTIEDGTVFPTAPFSRTPVPSSPTATPAASPTPSSARADQLAQSPAYFLYYVSKGDTLSALSRAFGTGTVVFASKIKEDNQLASDTITEGQPLAIPLALPGDLSLIPDSFMEQALGIGTTAGALQLLQPSLAMRSGYKGLIVLHRVTLHDDNPAGEGRGYLTEYWLTDRPPIKGGEVDPDAKVAKAEFIVGAGSLASKVPSTPADRYQAFTRDGVQYAVSTFAGSQLTPSQVIELLQTASQR